MKKKRQYILYVLYTIIYLLLFSFLRFNYNGSLKVNTLVFIIQGVMLLIYIPWTIWLSLLKYRSKKEHSHLVIGIFYSLHLLLVYFGEIGRYIDFVRFLENV